MVRFFGMDLSLDLTHSRHVVLSLNDGSFWTIGSLSFSDSLGRIGALGQLGSLSIYGSLPLLGSFTTFGSLY